MDSLFDIFEEMAGADIKALEKKVEAKKAETKKAEKKADVKKTAAKPAVTYKTPITVETGYKMGFSIGSDAFGGKEEGITETELLNVIEILFPYFQRKATKLVRLSETKCFIALTAGVAQTKGTVKITPDTSCWLGDKKIPLTNFLTDDETELEVTKLESELIPSIRVKIVFDAAKNVLSVIPGSVAMGETEKIKLPVEISVITNSRNVVTLTSADFISTDSETENENEEDEEDEEASASTESSRSEASVKEIQDVLMKRYPNYGKYLRLCSCRDENNKVIGYVTRVAVPENAPQVQKETTYSVKDGLRISLLYVAYDTTPADFGGKEEITVKDIALYLRKQGHEDYDDAHTYVSRYEKEQHRVTVIFKGGTKG